MEPHKIAGILSIILGLIFIICPFFGTAVVSVMIGLSLLFLGIILILAQFSALNIVVGLLSIIVGIIFITNIAALSFLFGFLFYVVGIILILVGITGLVSAGSKLAAIGIIILGIISFALGGFSIDNPIFAAVLIGVSLIVEGIGLYTLPIE